MGIFELFVTIKLENMTYMKTFCCLFCLTNVFQVAKIQMVVLSDIGL